MSATTVLRRPPPSTVRFTSPDSIPDWLGGSRPDGRRLLARLPALGVGFSTLAASGLAWVAAFWLRFDGSLPGATAAFMLEALPLVFLVKGAILWMNGVFRIVWAYVGIADVLALLRASGLAMAASYGILAAFIPERIAPRSIAVLDGVLMFLGTSGVFVLLRATREARRMRNRGPAPRDRVLIAGAGDAGEILLRELQWKFGRTHEVVGFLDDAPEKQGARLRGVPVLGTTGDLAPVAGRHNIAQILVAIPSAGGGLLRRITKAAAPRGVRVQHLPAVGQLVGRSALLPQMRPVSIEDLLRRSPVIDEAARIADFLRGKNILVTGAAGSIGSQLCRQILAHDPARLVVVDGAETPLHDLLLELRKDAAGPRVASEMADVTDAARVRQIFADHRPDAVFHAAALKHVPMCEAHPREAIRVNVGGTRLLAEAAIAAGVRNFVLISTDKAVNPSSVMGATKRVAEILLQKLGERGGPTQFVAVRFGNVLGSNGSVIPLFRRQLAEGGPLTVTHPDMRRYFMAISEAVGLVLHAACLGRGGDLFELDMGEPVRIVDLAEDLIRLSGLVPGRDVRIEFTGMRPGEKLFEELYFSAEKVVPTSHPRIFCLRAEKAAEREPAVLICLKHLKTALRGGDPVLSAIREDLERILGAEEREGSLA
jgi:FlaA1/EpsC-like NDP-sugar epimerase